MKYRLYIRAEGIESTLMESDDFAKIADAYYTIKRNRSYARIAKNGVELPICKADALVSSSRKRRNKRSETDMPTGADHSYKHFWSV